MGPQIQEAVAGGLVVVAVEAFGEGAEAPVLAAVEEEVQRHLVGEMVSLQEVVEYHVDDDEMEGYNIKEYIGTHLTCNGTKNHNLLQIISTN